jgi:enterochelin esterase-like enzyme
VTVLATAFAATVLLPGFSQVAAGPWGGEVDTGIFPGGQRPGYVYLPPGFTTVRRYPVVYLLHGMPGSPNEYLAGTNLANWADEQITLGAIRPFIAVMPAAGPNRDYNGEWAVGIESALVKRVVPWVDAWLPTVASRGGRILAGLSAGGYGAADIGLRHPDLFGTIEAWSAYFHPLRDGPFKHATRAELEANDPTTLVPAEAATLRRDGTRFFVSTGPAHSHWFTPADTVAFARELRGEGIPVSLRAYVKSAGEWRHQLDAGLTWALHS